MTLERAMEILDTNHREHYESIEPVNEACEIGRKAIEKLIAMKPKETDAYPHRLYCPICYHTFCYNKENVSGIIELNMFTYCPVCGQKIDWSEV